MYISVRCLSKIGTLEFNLTPWSLSPLTVVKKGCKLLTKITSSFPRIPSRSRSTLLKGHQLIVFCHRLARPRPKQQVVPIAFILTTLSQPSHRLSPLASHRLPKKSEALSLLSSVVRPQGTLGHIITHIVRLPPPMQEPHITGPDFQALTIAS